MKSNCFYTEKGVMPLIKSKNIPFPHGFSTREGGVSHGNGRDTLDLGSCEGNDVNENRIRFVSALCSDCQRLVFAKQIHSSKVEIITKYNYKDGFECDGFVTKEKNIIIAVKTADCVPILLCDEENGVVSALHAGWRGTVSGIATEGIKKMLSLGARAENITAAIGHSIGKCCYEVDVPFVKAVKESPYGNELLHFIEKSDKESKFYADLKAMNFYLLTSAGVKAENIATDPDCTCCKSDILFSHRASKGKRGLMMAGICLP